MTEDAEVWAARRLAEFLALISRFDDEAAAGQHGVERIAEAFDAEVGALMREGSARFIVGFPPGEAPEDALGAVASGESQALRVAGLGECPAVAVELEGRPPASLILARRPDEPFSTAEVALMRGMGTVLSLGLRGLGLVEAERRMRASSERQAAENLRLLSTLRERQALLEHLSQLQRAIVDRRPLHEVLQVVAESGCELIADDVAMLRLRDPDDPHHTVLVASVGADPGALETNRRSRAESGIGGKAMREGRLVVVDAVAGDDAAKAFLTAHGVASAMAAPVSEGGDVVGSLAVGSREQRHYNQRDQQILLALAEHASLALNHARAVEEAIHESLHDSLTGLPNRNLLLDRLRQALARAARNDGTVAVLFCDLDGFKTINDSLGPSAGDELLVEVGKRISAALRPADTVARLGGDEFAVLLDEVADRTEAVRTARRILESLEAPVELGDREIWAGASVGIASGAGDPETLLRNADLAMYRAKSSGRGRYAVFEPQMHTAVVERLDLEVDLKRAIEREELALVYQPIYELRTERISGLEALVRWRHPTRGLVVPARFVPLAEQSGQIGALGRWVLRTACHQAAIWRAKYPAHLGLGVSVNISGVELGEPTISKEVAAALGAAGLDPGGLTLEITETALMEDSEGSVKRLEALKRLGVSLAVDDFGTGYSSLRYLQRFPLDTLKIDRFFVDEIGREGAQLALLRAMVDLADNFGLDVVAEGIESTAQRNQLIELGCEMGQGLHLSPPLPVEAADALLLGAGLLPPPRRPDADPVAEAPEGDAAHETQ